MRDPTEIEHDGRTVAEIIEDDDPDLSGANLRYANLTDADLTDVDLTDSNVNSAKTDGAVGLEE